jgi:hypothetical protein
MSRKKDRIADIADPRTNSALSSVRDDIIRASGAFSTMRPLNTQDIRWLELKAFDSTTKFVILSQILLPRICSIIGRGLTMEEMGLLTGIDQRELKSLLRKPSVKDSIVMEVGKVDRSEYVNIHLPFRKIIKIGEADFEERIKEPMLAPKRLVDDIRRNGYMTEDGHLWRYDYISLVSGPLPVAYIFRSIRDGAEETMEKEIGKDGIEALSNDPTVGKAEQEIASSITETIKPLFEDERFTGYLKKMVDFFSETYANAVRYAWRYRALNDMETFDRIEMLARPFLLVANDVENSLRDKSPKP